MAEELEVAEAVCGAGTRDGAVKPEALGRAVLEARVSAGRSIDTDGVAVDACHESSLGCEATSVFVGAGAGAGAGVIIDGASPRSLGGLAGAGPASAIEVSRPRRVAGTSNAVAASPAEGDACEASVEGSREAAKLGGSEGAAEERGRLELVGLPAVGTGRRATRGSSKVLPVVSRLSRSTGGATARSEADWR